MLAHSLASLFTTEALAQAQAKPRPGPSPPNGPGLMFFQARALQSQAQAMAFRPGQARCITKYAVTFILLHYTISFIMSYETRVKVYYTLHSENYASNEFEGEKS
jgi:hypothetical protein